MSIGCTFSLHILHRIPQKCSMTNQPRRDKSQQTETSGMDLIGRLQNWAGPQNDSTSHPQPPRQGRNDFCKDSMVPDKVISASANPQTHPRRRATIEQRDELEKREDMELDSSDFFGYQLHLTGNVEAQRGEPVIRRRD
jgi:hypothetical protein